MKFSPSHSNVLKTLIVSCAIALVPISALADDDLGDDSSADLAEGFFNQVQQSEAVVLRVKINENGEENTSTTQMRVVTDSEAPTNYAQAEAAFNTGIDAESQPQITQDDIDEDSSTWGFFRYRYHYWAAPYYYYSYAPVYYYAGVTRVVRTAPYYFNCIGCIGGYRYYYYVW